jgi:tyrosinase
VPFEGLSFSRALALYLGLMADPVYASLDPIFYLHHCMIDALWAYWNTLPNPSNPGGTNGNPTVTGWLNPPFPNNPRMFLMPWESAGPGTTWHYLPQDVTKLGGLSVRLSNGTSVAYDYSYDFLVNPVTSVTPFKPLASGLALGAGQFAKRLAFLSAPAIAPITSAPAVRASELLGASTGPSSIDNDGTNITVRINTGVRAKLSASLLAASASSPPDRVFLKLESVKGTSGGTSLGVYINVPGGAKERAGSAGLFGLRQASKMDDKHGGNGLSFIFDISNIIDKLHLANALDAGVLSVDVAPYRPIPAGKNVTVGRISVYRVMH